MTTETSILEALDIAALPPEEQEAILLDLNSLIFKGTMIRLVERMDESTRSEFEKLMDSDADEEAMESFLKENVPDADAAITETVQELTNDILAATGT